MLLQVRTPCHQRTLEPLTGLTNLQSLSIKAPGADMCAFDWLPDPDYWHLPFPGQLQCLTELQLPLDVLQDISSIGNCINVCDLQLLSSSSYHAPRGVRWSEWAALAKVTHLTCVRLEARMDAPDDEEQFYGLLRQLKELRAVGAYTWKGTALPVLRSLTNVTAVYGGWELREGVDFSGLVCPNIRELVAARGSIPWQVLPNLTSLTLEDESVANLQGLSTHCTGLQKIVLSTVDPCVRPEHAEYVPAFASLAKLQHLTHLELSALNDAELMAFTCAAAAANNTLQLRYLRVFAPKAMLPLSHLLNVRRVEELCLHVRHDKAWIVGGIIPYDDVRGLLVGFAHVPKVSLVLCTGLQRNVVNEAKQWAARMGLPLPAVLKVSVGATQH
jgi:hypothetical protein